MRVPPSETVAYQRPDHRLRPSTGTLLVIGFYPQQGVIWPDKKTPNGPKDCPAGSCCCWDTIHFTSPSVNGIKGQGSFSRVGWDHRLVIKGCPLTLWFLAMIIAGFCSAVKVKAKSLFLKSRCDPSCQIAFYSIRYLVRTKTKRVDLYFKKQSIKMMVQSILGGNQCY